MGTAKDGRDAFASGTIPHGAGMDVYVYNVLNKPAPMPVYTPPPVIHMPVWNPPVTTPRRRDDYGAISLPPQDTASHTGNDDGSVVKFIVGGLALLWVGSLVVKAYHWTDRKVHQAIDYSVTQTHTAERNTHNFFHGEKPVQELFVVLPAGQIDVAKGGYSNRLERFFNQLAPDQQANAAAMGQPLLQGLRDGDATVVVRDAKGRETMAMTAPRGKDGVSSAFLCHSIGNRVDSFVSSTLHPHKTGGAGMVLKRATYYGPAGNEIDFTSMSRSFESCGAMAVALRESYPEMPQSQGSGVRIQMKAQP